MWIPPSEKMYLHEPSRGIVKVPFSRKVIYRTLAVLVVVLLHWHFFSKSSSSPRGLPTSLENTFSSTLSDSLLPLNHSDSATNQLPTVKGPAKFSKELIDFWHQLAPLLIDTEPPVPIEDDENVPAYNYNFNNQDIPDTRVDTLKVTEHEIQMLRQAHENFLQKAQKLAPKLPYKKGSRGIVTTAAGDYLPELLVSLRILRNSGSKLPVEVFMESPDSYEPGICEEVLPSLNAKCYIFSDILDSGEAKVTLSRFQYKPFAMLFSSFEDFLLLDADNLAVHRPEDLMDAEPYVTAGLVVWPDYWVNTASSAFYEIASFTDVPTLKDRAASESGQMILSKRKQSLTLLLATYYNVYGFTHYYTLLSQHSFGQGDKETYLAAALAINATFYDVKAPISTLGFHPRGPGAEELGGYAGTGCIQRDPRDDANPFFTDIRPAFLHAQTYKLNAARLPERYFTEINGRMFGSEEHVRETFNGRDMEKEAWEEMIWTACEIGSYFKGWQENEEEICQTVKWIYHSLFG